MKIIERIKKIFTRNRKPKKNPYFPRYKNEKLYKDMNRKEKRHYKRWLHKNNLWDGAVVAENLTKNKRL